MSKLQGTILLITRRMVLVQTALGETFEGKTRSRSLEAVVGDHVQFSLHDGEAIVEDVLPRRNLLRRAAEEKEKLLVANIDLLCVVTAPYPLCNPRIIDRIFAAALHEEIPAVLIANKFDLLDEQTFKTLDEYRAIPLPVITVSAKFAQGLELLFEQLDRTDVHTVALCGVSGVGKSSLLKRLIPGVTPRTNEVSERTGQGKQTTSQAIAYVRTIEDRRQLIVDLPGVQRFGLHHLSLPELQLGFPEITRRSSQCRFRNCLHEQEPDCAVRKAVADGGIAPTRYDHYVEVLVELQRAKAY